jgi:ankyrin repeat protein
MAAIHQALLDSKFAEVKRLLEAEADCVNAKLEENDDLPLHIAAYQDDAELVKLLLDHGAIIDGRGNRGLTPLHLAAKEGCAAAVAILIERGADLDARDEDNFSPLFYAARGRERGCSKIARMLRKAGARADLNLAVCLGDQALVERIFAEDPDAIKNAPLPNDLVLDAVTQIQCQIWKELSPANTNPDENLAVMKANDGILRLLLEHGAPIDKPQFGWSPLFESCQMHHPYVTELLLEHGADPNVRRSPGGGLKSVMRIPGGGDAMLKILEKYGFKFQRLY